MCLRAGPRQAPRKRQFVQFVEYLSYVLLALEIAGRLAGLPVTHLSSIAKELTTAIPKDARKMISQFAETLKDVDMCTWADEDKEGRRV